MLLDLYITHWNEPWEVCKPGFEMLKNQRCMDWDQVRVTVVHDGTPVFPEETFTDYPFEVHQVSIEHRGIAGVRNWCLDNGDGTWIKMNDCDDLFVSVYSLKEVVNGLEQAGDDYDYMWFEVYAESKGKRYLKNERDPVVLHGKVFRRSFLREKNLRFNEDLTWCEDSAFLAVLEFDLNVKRIGKITGSCPMYAWVHRNGSLCNRPEILFDNLKSFFRRHCYVAEEGRKRGFQEFADTMVARIACDSFYTLQVADVKEDKSEHERRVWEYLKEHRDEILRVKRDMFDKVVEATNTENVDCHITREEVVTWIRSLKQKYEGGDG